jgi:hypothetical protein
MMEVVMTVVKLIPLLAAFGIVYELGFDRGNRNAHRSVAKLLK